MVKTIGSLVAGVSFLASHSAQACRGNTLVPPHGQAAQYQVLLVEVTGTHLTDYEWYRAASLGAAPWPKTADGDLAIYPTSSTPSFTVNAIVRRATRGASPPFREFKLGGCGILVPPLKETGLIFIAPDGRVGAVWATQHPQYNLWLQELGLGTADEP
jgi:hypothetical protein